MAVIRQPIGVVDATMQSGGIRAHFCRLRLRTVAA
jgi:hypothetical protein